MASRLRTRSDDATNDPTGKRNDGFIYDLPYYYALARAFAISDTTASGPGEQLTNCDLLLRSAPSFGITSNIFPTQTTARATSRQIYSTG